MSENQDNDLSKIQEWLSKQPHLPHDIDSVLLRRFLHICRYSLEKTKHLLDLFFTIRSQAPEIFSNRDPLDASFTEICKVIDIVPLPKTTKDNYKVFVYRLCDPDPEKFNFLDSVKAFFMFSDIRMKLDAELHSGEVPIFDMGGYSMRHLTKTTLPILKKYMTYTQEGHPVRLKQIHVINVAPFLDRCLALVKPLMKSEVASMLHFHQPNSKTIYEYIPEDILPEEYGGSVGKLSDLKKEWLEKIYSNRDYFTDETRWNVDESKRPIENTNRKEHFGMQGSFRSLAID